MGQKVHPNGIRLGITKPFASTWFASTKDFASNLAGDHKVREFLKEKLKIYIRYVKHGCNENNKCKLDDITSRCSKSISETKN